MEEITMDSVLSLFKDAEIDIDVSEFEPSESLNRQGLDSLDMMNVFFQIEDKFGVTVSEESIAAGDWDSLDKIMASLKKHLS